MASIDRTAYPRLRAQLTDAELEADYTLSEDEAAFVRRHARGGVGRLSMAVSLKTRQRLGYFPALTDVPDQVRLHIANGLGLEDQVELLDGVTQATTLHRYREAIRKRLGSRPFSHGGREVLIKTVHRAAQVIDARRSARDWHCPFSSGSRLRPFPRLEGVICIRCLLLGANTPWNRVRLTLGLGTSAASRAKKGSARDTCKNFRFVLRAGCKGWSSPRTHTFPATLIPAFRYW